MLFVPIAPQDILLATQHYYEGTQKLKILHRAHLSEFEPGKVT